MKSLGALIGSLLKIPRKPATSTAKGRIFAVNDFDLPARARNQELETDEVKTSAFLSWRYYISLAIGPFLLSRLWCGIFLYWGHSQHAYLSPIEGGWEGVANWWLNPFTTFDSRHFIDIAAHGYNAQTAAFFPLYPYFLRLAGSNPIAMAGWGIILSNLCFLAALPIFARLTERDYSPRVARLAVWLLAFCPTTIYFSAVYTDAMFLLFFVAAFWNVRNRNWILAACWAFVASLTRNAAPLLFLGLLLEYFTARKQGQKMTAPIALAILAPIFALILAQGFIAVQVGDIARGVTSQQEYYRVLTFPLFPILLDLRDIFLLQARGIVILHLGATLAAFILVARAWKKQALSYSAMTIGLMLMHLTFGHTITPYTLPSARYLSSMFPFTQRVAVEVETLFSTRFRTTLVALMILCVCAVISYLFGEKSFIG